MSRQSFWDQYDDDEIPASLRGSLMQFDLEEDESEEQRPRRERRQDRALRRVEDWLEYRDLVDENRHLH